MTTSGWVVFASIMLVMAGMFGATFGLVAIINEEVFLVSDDQAIIVDVKAWGWLHLIVGSIAFFAGLGVLSGQLWAVIFGVLLAIVSATTQLLFITVFPWWSLTVITIDILVIYGLIVHGTETEVDVAARGVQAGRLR